MSEPVYVTAIINPAPGKIERTKELLAKVAKMVKEQEADVLQYQYFEQINGENGTNSIVVHEIYKNKAAFEKHITMPHIAELIETSKTENLLASAPEAKICKSFAGFESR